MNLTNIENHVKAALTHAETGHDWWHVTRVMHNAEKLLNHYPSADKLVARLTVLLHDIADAKFHDGDETKGPLVAQQIMEKNDVDPSTIHHVCHIIRHMSYKGGHAAVVDKSLEFQIVQDADRLDAIGAIGIARTFNFGGHRNNEIYNPNKPPQIGMSKEAYKQYNGTTVNHFYEKLLLLKDLMNTQAAKQMAEERHQFMVLFLDQLQREIPWEDK